MLEKHPFEPFLPKNAKYLLLGSFPGRKTPENTWYYGTKRTQIWKILESVYNTHLPDVGSRKVLLKRLGMAVSDVILVCERTRGNNLDSNLKIRTYNTLAVESILKTRQIGKIYFSSRFVEHIFRTKFKNVLSLYPNIELITLPSPSPRYAQLTLSQKIDKYKENLPKI